MSSTAFNEDNLNQAPEMDKSALSVVSLSDDSDVKAYWLTRSPQERLEAVELMRRINYGNDAASARLQRVLEVVERPSG